jgi:uncharacterized protein
MDSARFGRTPLMAAAAFGSREELATLLSTGVDPDERDQRGMTALMFAASLDRTDQVESLLRAGAKPSVRDNDGLTALLHAAAGKGQQTVLDLLLASGATLDERDASGRGVAEWIGLRRADTTGGLSIAGFQIYSPSTPAAGPRPSSPSSARV